MGFLKRSLQIALPAVAALAMAAPASAAVTFNYSYLYGYVYSGASVGNSSASDNGSAGDTTYTLGDLEAFFDSDAKVKKSGVTQAEGKAEGSTTADFTGAESGVITFLTESSAKGTVAGAYAYGSSYYNYFHYEFYVDEASDFDFTFSTFDDGLYDNYSSYAQLYSYDTGDGFYINPLDDDSGAFTTSIGPGTYYLDIQDYYNYSAYAEQYGVGTTTASREDIYTFNITSMVPEPASWALMIGGFGMMGPALRRRRAAAFA